MSGYCDDLCYKIDNPSYTLTSFFLKEYSHYQNNNNEVVFDTMVSAAQNLIECAFGPIKAKWTILTRKMNLKLHKKKCTTSKICLFFLYNFCELENIAVDEEQVRKHNLEIHNVLIL